MSLQYGTNYVNIYLYVCQYSLLACGLYNIYMKVIFIHDIGGVGRRNEIKNVTDGYALNFLIPNGHAVQATAERVKALQDRLLTEKRAVEARNQKSLQGIERLKGATVQILAHANPTGGLYQALTTQLISNAIQREYGVHIPPESIEMSSPIKMVGNSHVTIRSGSYAADMTVAVRKNG